MTWAPNLCLYHKDCLDGFGAAWAIWKRWPECEFIGVEHGKSMPDVAGRDVLFVDFAPKIEWIWEASFKSRSMVIIDHHKSAQADLARLPQFDGSMPSLDEAFKINWTQNSPELAAWFDMEQSGAAMAWKFAHRGTDLPLMIEYIQDRDLWRQPPMEGSRAFNVALQIYPMQFDIWDKLSAKFGINGILEQGKIILFAHSANVDKFLDNCYYETIGGFENVPTVNVPYLYASDVGNRLLNIHALAPFSACWSRSGGTIHWSLRSENGRTDVSEVAKLYGGGGHRNAAGFEIAAVDMAPVISK